MGLLSRSPDASVRRERRLAAPARHCVPEARDAAPLGGGQCRLRAEGGGPRAGSGERSPLLQRGRIGSLADRPARRLSGGEQQRLALARALAREPEVLFLDEPTASLDPAATKSVEDIIARAAAGGVKIVMATHDLGQARRLAGDIVFPGQRPPRRACRRPQLFRCARHGGGQALPGRRSRHLNTEHREERASCICVISFFALLSPLALAAAQAQDKSIVVASTTSTQDSGLFGHHPADVQGQDRHRREGHRARHRPGARYGRRGDADVVFVHAKAAGREVRRRRLWREALRRDVQRLRADRAEGRSGQDQGRQRRGRRAEGYQRQATARSSRAATIPVRMPPSCAVEGGRPRSGQRQAGLVSRDRPGHGRGAQHGRRHGRLRAVRSRHLDFLQEQGRPGHRGGGRPAPVQPVRHHPGEP